MTASDQNPTAQSIYVPTFAELVANKTAHGSSAKLRALTAEERNAGIRAAVQNALMGQFNAFEAGFAENVRIYQEAAFVQAVNLLIDQNDLAAINAALAKNPYSETAQKRDIVAEMEAEIAAEKENGDHS